MIKDYKLEYFEYNIKEMKELRPEGSYLDYTKATRREFVLGCGKLLSSLVVGRYLPSGRPVNEDTDTTRILLLADIHVGKFDSISRQANAGAPAILPVVLSLFNYRIFDAVADLGDKIIDTGTDEERIANLTLALTPFQTLQKKLSIPTIQLIGNHELWNFTPDRLSQAFQELGFNNQFYGVQKFSNFQMVSLDWTPQQDKANGFLPQDRIDWLRQVIYPDTPTIILTHEGFIQQDVSQNYYFKNNPGRSFLENGQEAWNAIKDLPIKAVVSGHLHQTAFRVVDGVPMITLPSFTERLPFNNLGQVDPDSPNPGVYSILETNDQHLTIKSFSGLNCIFYRSV